MLKIDIQYIYNIEVIAMETKEHTCCFFGNRKIEVTDELVNRLEKVVDDLIKKGVKEIVLTASIEFGSVGDANYIK